MTWNFKRVGPYCYHLPADSNHGKCLLFATADLLPGAGDRALDQLVSVSRLPGLIGSAMAMPDIHQGYGFPIGGVAAFERNSGVISPGGVGYDINCGVRLYNLGLLREDFAPHCAAAVKSIFQSIPSGVGAGSRFPLKRKDLLDVLASGARWCVRNDFGSADDLESIEDGGWSALADPDLLSDKALERGMAQLGSLGGGNHFIELQYVDQIIDPTGAERLGLYLGGVTLMIHTGSRGLGYQVCSDALVELRKHRDLIPAAADTPELVSVPVRSAPGERYYRAMMTAANYAWANRQKIGHHAVQALRAVLGDVQAKLVYDLGHNLARIEEVETPDGIREAMIHRKGASRALPPGDIMLTEKYRDLGQPVILPGDMGRASWVLLGSSGNGQLSFSSVSHGAGRRLSRKQAAETLRQKDVLTGLNEQGICLMAASRRSIIEEAPVAYKNVDDIMEVVTGCGLARSVARLKPLGVIKG